MNIDQSQLDEYRTEIGKEALELLEIAFQETRANYAGIPADKFRIKYRDKRDLLDFLVQKELLTDHRMSESNIFRLTGLGVSLLRHPEAMRLVDVMNSILMHLSERYVTVQTTETIPVLQMKVDLGLADNVAREALLLLNDLSAWSHGCSADFPFGEYANVRTGECNLDIDGITVLINRNIGFRLNSSGDQQAASSVFGLTDFDSKVESVAKQSKISMLAPRGVQHLEKVLANLVTQVEFALREEMYFLASLGLRAIADIVMTDMVGDVGTFKQKLRALGVGGHFTEEQIKHLDAVIDVGSASMHRGHEPPKEDVETCAAVVAHLLYQQYEAHSKIESLKKNTPARTKK